MQKKDIKKQITIGKFIHYFRCIETFSLTHKIASHLNELFKGEENTGGIANYMVTSYTQTIYQSLNFQVERV